MKCNLIFFRFIKVKKVFINTKNNKYFNRKISKEKNNKFYIKFV